MENKETRGGFRVGAGKPSLGDNGRVTITFRVSPKTKKMVEVLKKKGGLRLGRIIDEHISTIFYDMYDDSELR